MAQVLPAKRPRGLTVPRLHQHKRQRVSIEPSEPDDSPSSNSDVSASNLTDNEEEEAAYIRATQIVEKSLKRKQNQKNVPADAGIIEEIRCTNFMCHEQLTVTLGPLINFIIGHNGSGKSAVLTALTICLGGKASATNRGQNLKSFIKAGREYCNLAVKIKNQGKLAYKPETYGDSIIIERHFNLAGTSGFKLKDRNGKIVSQKKVDVEDVIDAFAMQLDNPMNVLTQDMARQFLNDSNPKDKYKFFLKGTQLEALDNDYKQIAAELEEQEARAETLKGDVDIYRKNFEEAVARAKRAKNLEKMRQKEQSLANQAAWAQVEAEERELAEIESELDRVTSLIEERKVKADTESDQYARRDQLLEQAKEEIQQCEDEIRPLEAELNEHHIEWKAIKDKIFRFKADGRRIESGIKAGKKAVEQSQSRIEEQKDRQAQADDGIHAQKLQELEEAKAIYEERKSAWETYDDEHLPVLKREVAQAINEKNQADESVRKKRTEITSSNAKIRALKQNNHNWIDSYRNPPVLAKVLKAIENETRFKERPVGPIGRHVELQKPQWGSILEKSFGATLEAFVVTSKDDQNLLSSIMRRMNHHAPIYIVKNTPIDTRGHEPAEELLTWMRALKINNDLVRNLLIINQSIEQVVLIEKRNDAQDFMNRPASERKNIRMCFCFSEKSRRRGHSITVSQNGSSSFGPIHEYTGHLRMQADKGPQLQEEEEMLKSLQSEVQSLEASARSYQEQLTACNARLQDHGKQKRKLKMEMDHAQDEMTRLEGEVAASLPDVALTEQLNRELVEAKANLEKDETQYEDLTNALDHVNKESRERKKRVEELTRVLEESRLRAEKIRVKVTTLTQRREEALRAKNKALEDVQQAELNKADWERRRGEQQQQVDTYMANASEISPRVEVPSGQTFQSLLNKLEALQKDREQSERELGGSEEELLAKAVDARKAYKDAEREINGTQAVRNKLKQALVRRKQHWLRFRQSITTRARIIFNYLLSERQFRGSLDVDHENQLLDINVQPDITVQSATGRQTKTLSGGEKSFSTICLLLALWDAMGSPIRCLDEFDVFMDSVNRDVSMTLIIGAARRAVGRQYILITPQSMNNKKVHSMDDVKIIRMEDPERGQTTLTL